MCLHECVYRSGGRAPDDKRHTLNRGPPLRAGGRWGGEQGSRVTFLWLSPVFLGFFFFNMKRSSNTGTIEGTKRDARGFWMEGGCSALGSDSPEWLGSALPLACFNAL